MQLIEKYSLDCGINPGSLDKEAPYSSFVPLGSERFVVFSSFSENEEGEFQRYPLLQEVFDILKKHLDENKINYFFLPKNEKENIIGMQRMSPNLSVDKISYIAKRSCLFIGISSVVSHVFNIVGTPSICIIGKKEKGRSDAYWKDESRSLFFNERASEIKPEEVAKEAIKLIGISEEPKDEFQTIFVGEKYPAQTIEVVPDLITSPEFAKDYPIAFRMDFLEKPTEEHLKNVLLSSKDRQSVMVLDRPLEEIFKYKKQINQTQLKGILFNLRKSFWVKLGEEEIENFIVFIDKLSKMGRKFALGAKDSEFNEEEKKKLKFLFLDVCPVNFSTEISIDLENLEMDTDKVYMKSSRFIFSNRKKFLSKQAYTEDKPVDAAINHQKLSEIQDLTSLSKELESSYIYFKE